MGADDVYANIRDPELLGTIIGARIVDVTQHDKEEFDEDGVCYVSLHLDNGTTVTFSIDPDCDHPLFSVESGS